MESILGAILSSTDPQVKVLINNLRKDELARDILTRVDSGPFVSFPGAFFWCRMELMAIQGPTGRLSISAGMTKEDFFASIMNSDNQHPRDPSRPKRQSRMSREIVSSSTCCSWLLTFVSDVTFSRQLDPRYANLGVARPPLEFLCPDGQPRPVGVPSFYFASPCWRSTYPSAP